MSKLLVALPVFIGLFLTIYIAYIATSPMYQTLMDSTSSLAPTEAATSRSLLAQTWAVWPILIFIGLAVWLVVYLIRREPRTYGVGY